MFGFDLSYLYIWLRGFSILDRVAADDFDDVVAILRDPQRNQSMFIPTRDVQGIFEEYSFVKTPEPLTDQSASLISILLLVAADGPQHGEVTG
jgi:hypothetical protein